MAGQDKIDERHAIEQQIPSRPDRSRRAFAEFVSRLPHLDLSDHRGNQVTAERVVDHEGAYSLYFSDPFGHRLELTTYDYEKTRTTLERGLD